MLARNLQKRRCQSWRQFVWEFPDSADGRTDPSRPIAGCMRLIPALLRTACFTAFHSHWEFEAGFCNPREAQERGKVESGIGHAQRTPLKGLCFESLTEREETQ